MVLERFGIENIQDTLIWDITFTPVVFILAYLLYFGLQKGKASVVGLYRREKYIYKREA
jgi:hypothetical protein